jgi:glutamyl-tRNA reductase
MDEIVSILITHKWAGLNDLECARINDVHGMLQFISALDGVNECVILQTCNRVEVFLAVDSNFNCKTLINAAFPNVSPHLIGQYGLHETLKHLLRLASGLESMIIGEDQILGQLREALEISRKADSVGSALNIVISKAINVGKRVRTETQINRGSVSIGSAAVDLVESILGTLDGKSILTIGAGELGTLVAMALAERKLSAIFVSNRTFRRAQTLARQLNGHAVRFDEIDEYLKRADVVISATASPHYVLTYDQVQRAMLERQNAKLLIVDIANPRDVEESVSRIPHVELQNIDDLRQISEQNLKRRKSEVGKVHAIINEELRLLEEQYKKQRVERLIANIYKNAESIRRRELEKALSRIKQGNGKVTHDDILNDLTNSIVKKMLFEITDSIKEAAINDDDTLLLSASKLFKLLGD